MAISQNFPDIKPSFVADFANTKALDPRITFARASTGAYYDGVAHAKAEENLVLQSQALATSPWGQVRATRTNNATIAPDGTSTATAITQATGQTESGQAQQSSVSVAALTYTMSVFAKPNGKNFLQLVESFLDGSVNRTWFNVSTGTIGTTDAGHTATITASTEGFYRCSITFTVNAARTGTFIVAVADTDGSTTVVDSDGIYAWGAQLEQRSAVTSYTATTTQPITNYIPVLQTAPANTARFDHNPVTGESLGLLVEEQRTNLFTYSEQFDNAAWTKLNATVTENTIVSPDGTLTGYKLIPDTDNNNHNLVQGITFTSGTTYTLSFYVKKAEFSRFRMRASSQATWPGQADFDLIAVTATASNGTATITPIGNDMYRCSLTAAATGTATTGAGVFVLDNSGNFTFAGDGYSGIYIWGAQLESGSFSTSYIPTVASQVTRAADAASMTGANFSSWYRQDEGTLYVDATQRIESSNAGALVEINDNSFNERLLIAADTVSAGVKRTQFFVAASGVTQAQIFNASTFGSAGKVAAAYVRNNFATSQNGATALTDTTGLVPLVNQMFIGSRVAGSTVINGTIRKLSYYPARLTDTQLAALTS